MAWRGSDDALHVETSKLHLELNAALKEDISRKKTDEMKKRAIHTAGSYDEFRHMVSCAQLTPVTRKEMEMLSDQKRGWQGRSGGVVPTTKRPGHGGRKQSTRRQRNRDKEIIGGGAKTVSVRAPKDYSQFQRDWRRRYRTDEERRMYLRVIGPDKLPELFRVEMEPDVLGKVISLLCGEFSEHPVEPLMGGATPSDQEADRTGDGNAGSPDIAGTPFGEDEARRCMELLCALTKTGRFAVNILFLEEKEKLALARLFGLITAAVRDDSDEDPGRIQSLRKAYAV